MKEDRLLPKKVGLKMGRVLTQKMPNGTLLMLSLLLIPTRVVPFKISFRAKERFSTRMAHISKVSSNSAYKMGMA